MFSMWGRGSPCSPWPSALVVVLFGSMKGGIGVHGFSDVTEQVLPPYTQTRFPSDRNVAYSPSGVCTLDANNDGFPDLYFMSGQQQNNALMLNDGTGNFDDVTEEWGVSLFNATVNFCLAVDLDNDGCDDLVLSGGGQFSDTPLNVDRIGTYEPGNFILKNMYCQTGNTIFQEMTPPDFKNWERSWHASAADINNDGLVDIFVSSLPFLDLSNFPGAVPLNVFPGRSLLLKNLGDFAFEDISDSSKANRPLCPCMSVFLDYNNDGYIDLMPINCGNDIIRVWQMQFFHNNGDDTFNEVADQVGLYSGGPNGEPKGMWMGAGIGDYNKDGCLDVAITNLATDAYWPKAQPHTFYGKCEDGDYGFEPKEWTVEPGMGETNETDQTLFAWGPVARDFNNDGNLDVFQTGNYLIVPNDLVLVALNLTEEYTVDDMPQVYTSPEVLYGQAPGASEYMFSKEVLDFYDNQVDDSIEYTTGDYNGDGALDIVVAVDTFFSRPGSRDGRPIVMYGTPNDNNWLGVRLAVPPPYTKINRQAIGSVARLYNKADGSVAMTLILSAGSGSMSTEEKTLYFGLGTKDGTEYELGIVWPSKTMEEEERFDMLTENTIMTITMGDGETKTKAPSSSVSTNSPEAPPSPSTPTPATVAPDTPTLAPESGAFTVYGSMMITILLLVCCSWFVRFI